MLLYGNLSDVKFCHLKKMPPQLEIEPVFCGISVGLLVLRYEDK